MHFVAGQRLAIQNDSDEEDIPVHADLPDACMLADNTILEDGENDEIDRLLDGD